MGQITTKMDPGQTGYVMDGSKIAAVTVTEVKPDEKVGSTTIVNTCTNADGSSHDYDEAEIWATPEDLAADLVAQWHAANPPAPTSTDTGTAQA